MSLPICYDLYCGLGGWSEGFIANGYRCIGYDIEAHDYGQGGYPGELRLHDVRSLHGSQFKDATCIVGSSPCQEFSYRAMPWKRAKALGPPLLGIELFQAQFRIQREACEAAGRYIPMVVENVRGAQPWVGRSRWHYGSFHLWGDVPALMPSAADRKLKTTGPVTAAQVLDHNCHINEMRDAFKTVGHANIRDGHSHTRHLTNQAENEGLKVAGLNFSDRSRPAQGFNVVAAQRYREGVKFSQSGDAWFDGRSRDKMLGDKGPAAYGSRSNSRKAASAMIAKISFALSDHIAKCFLPEVQP